jgi:phage terminase small subunit
MGRNHKDGTPGKRKTFEEKVGDVDSMTGKDLAVFRTHTGHSLTHKQWKFINLYIECANLSKAAKEAGYSARNANQAAQNLINTDYIKEEIEYRLCTYESEKIASADEILRYFTSVMRGEIKDQFGLDAPLSERTKAAVELARRKIDVAQKNVTDEAGTVKLVIERPKTETKAETVIDIGPSDIVEVDEDA